MLILNKTTDCESITISSDVSDYSDNTITSIEITTVINCCDSTLQTYTITDFATPDSLLVTNTTTDVLEIVLLPEFFNTTDVINDGVYSITIKTIKNDLSFVEEKACILVDCYIKCKIVDLIEEGDFESHRLYEAIIMANECTGVDCDCATACNLYEQLINKLKISFNDANINNCGCS